MKKYDNDCPENSEENIVQNPNTTDKCLIEFNINQVITGKAIFLTDSGASASLVNADILKPEAFKCIDRSQVRTITGLSGVTVKSLGVLQMDLRIGNQKHTWNFHVLRNGIGTDVSGIIGRDFMKERMSIDFIDDNIKIAEPHKVKLMSDKDTTEMEKIQAQMQHDQVRALQNTIREWEKKLADKDRIIQREEERYTKHIEHMRRNVVEQERKHHMTMNKSVAEHERKYEELEAKIQERDKIIDQLRADALERERVIIQLREERVVSIEENVREHARTPIEHETKSEYADSDITDDEESEYEEMVEHGLFAFKSKQYFLEEIHPFDDEHGLLAFEVDPNPAYEVETFDVDTLSTNNRMYETKKVFKQTSEDCNNDSFNTSNQYCKTNDIPGEKEIHKNHMWRETMEQDQPEQYKNLPFDYNRIRYSQPDDSTKEIHQNHQAKVNYPVDQNHEAITKTTMPYIDDSESHTNIPTVLFGNHNQAHEMFDEKCRNYQCTAMAMCAIMYDKVTQVPDWQTTDVDNILAFGNQLYIHTIESNKLQYKSILAADEITGEMRFGKIFVKASCITSFDDYMQSSSKNVLTNIINFFDSNTYGIITFNNKSLAFIKFKPRNGIQKYHFAIFDSHINSNINEPSGAKLQTFNTISLLCGWFIDNHGGYKLYTITPVTVMKSVEPPSAAYSITKNTKLHGPTFTDIHGSLGFDVNGKAIDIEQKNEEIIIDVSRFANIKQKCTEWMIKQGYNKGKGLGLKLQGKVNPVKAKFREGRFGLGYIPTDKEIEDMRYGAQDDSLKRVGDKICHIEFISEKKRAYTSKNHTGINDELHAFLNINTEDHFTRVKRSDTFEHVPFIGNQILPARTETTLMIRVPEKGARVCVTQEICPGVLIANSITESDDGIAVVGVINSNEHEVSVENVNIVTQPIHEFAGLKATRQKVDRNRIEQLKNILKLDERSDETEQFFLHKICEGYSDLFLLPGEKLTSTNARVFKLPLIENKIINLPQYRIPEKHKQEVAKQIDKLLKGDVIEPSISPYNSPLLLVPKKSLEGSAEKLFRLCIDYRQLNKNLQPYQFPLPRIDEILDQLGSAKYFSTLDLSQGFHQVLIDKKDREKTAFSTAYGHYHYKRCPFGLKTLPGFFQSMLNNILTGLQGETCFVYIDDVVIFAKDLEEHDRKLTDILNRFKQYNLKLNPDKCHFMRKEVIYLGHKCSENGVEPDDKLMNSITNFPRPKTVRQVQSFHGLANYYRKFVRGFATIASPLYKIIKKDQKFNWTEECEQSFIKLKTALTSKPVLAFPDFTKEFTITTDASSCGLGAILEQEGRVIAYASKSLSATKKGWSATELELKGVVFGCQTFRCYVLGRKFKIFTDHAALKGEIKLQGANSRIIKLMQKLSEFDYEIFYKKGKENSHADCLSRIPAQEEDIEGVCNMLTRRQAAVQRNNQNQPSPTTSPSNDISSPKIADKTIIHDKSSSDLKDTQDDIVTKTIDNSNDNSKTQDIDTDNSDDEDAENTGNTDIEEITEEKDKLEIMKAYHDGILGGHFGVCKTYQRIKTQYHWPGMKKYIEQYINKCEFCQKNKNVINTRMPLETTSVSENAFDKIYVDVVGPLPVSSDGNKYILSMVDDLTKFVEFAPMADQTAETVAKTLFENILCRYNIPKKLVTDNGANFVGRVFIQLCKLLGVKKLRTTAYHPQSNLVERQHSTLGNYLRSFVKSKPHVWDTYLRTAAHAYNNTPHAGTGYAPMHMLFGFTSDIPANLKKKPEQEFDAGSYIARLRNKLQLAYNIGRKNLEKAKRRSKNGYDKKSHPIALCVGDRVLYKCNHRTSKLAAIWEGPYVVTQVHSGCNVSICIRNKEKRVHMNLLRKFSS